MSGFRSIDPLACEALIARVMLGDGKAWKALVEHIWPALRNIVASSRAMGPLAKDDDHVHDVLAKLVDKLAKDKARALGRYGAWRVEHRDKTFEDWIRIVTTNVVRDHVREVLSDATAYEAPGVKRLLNEFSGSPALAELAVRPPVTMAQTARELFEFAERRLPEAQHRTLVLWVEGASFQEIAAELGLPDDEAAAKLLRAAVAVLRRAFVQSTGA